MEKTEMGELAHNVKQLKEMLADLFLKIEGKRPSFDDTLARYFTEE